MIEQYFNPAQQEVNLISARDSVVVGGRGIGKSILHATFNLRNMQRMPGSDGGFVSANTKRCLTNTLPSMLQHWERWRALKKVSVFGKTNKKAVCYCTSEQFSDGQILNLFCLTQWLR